MSMKRELDVEQIRRRSKSIFERNHFVKRAFLFGSYARHEEKPESDIDFLVETEGEVGLDFFGLYDYLQEEFGKNIDVLTKEEADRIMKKNIEKDKVVIYERSDKNNI